VWVKETHCKECNADAVPNLNEYDEAICGNCGFEFSPEDHQRILQDSVLIDGHNRRTIAKELGKLIDCRFVSFANRENAKRWIAQNQLGRRNLTKEKREYCSGLLYNTEKKNEGRPEKRTQNENVFSGRTSERIAEKLGVSPATVVRAGEFATAVDAVDAAIPGAREKALSGEVSRQQVIEAAKEVKQGNTNAARATLDKGKDLKEKLKQDLQAKKEKDLAELPIRKRAQMLLDACPLPEAICVLAGLIPTKEERMREITRAIVVLKEIYNTLQRRGT
jgi:DNA-binding transcriptional regulator YdaS (Cro superfamily)